ncbi:hydrogenase nickel incorporation protein HypB [Martelella lutilitoris]|uniref:Hydrogenase maturation factor HypB n=1 Tax=Martelella lutilitoris TaxID=2583532 RepID=A0A5C4JM53_9HYPH|nr:hydrogenase nickel incorporation protein HypB [Martelella lutilitoris]TNB46252.1 hydrogenase nickel incorporation protein HypB [Martelella lutilitoris]
MCSVCGCGQAEIHGDQSHDHAIHNHGADHEATNTRLIRLEQDILARNNAFAAENRALLEGRGCLALNLVSSPGSGKTSLLIKTIEAIGDRHICSVIEGDQQTSVDAERIRATGASALQINTGKGCHLDGHMVAHALETLNPEAGAIVFIENVGNLVCPAPFDLGENHKVVILSVTEGDDKPLKYPDIFAASDLMIINKSDLSPYVDFDIDAAIANARRVNPKIGVLALSARTGEGMQAWINWIDAARHLSAVSNSGVAARREC